MHEKFMKLALNLALDFDGATSPNPLVGSVIVKNGEIIGKGAHQKAGQAHAEINAISSSKDDLSDSTIYINLEPCSHYGKTPPCVDAIIESGISQVVIAMEDPNPLVAGKGIQKLRENNIEVITGICEKETQQINEIFIKYITSTKPFVILKAAISLDGMIATKTNDAKWISNEQSRKISHKLRNKVDAIIIGKNTLLLDNPSLDVRIPGKKDDPQKIVIIPKLDIPLKKIQEMKAFKLSKNKPLIIVCEKNQKNESRKGNFVNSGIEIIEIEKKNNKLDLDELLLKFGKREITSLLLEGGSGIYHGFLEQNLVDKMHHFIAPIIIGSDGIHWAGKFQTEKLSSAHKFDIQSIEQLNDNIHVISYPAKKEN